MFRFLSTIQNPSVDHKTQRDFLCLPAFVFAPASWEQFRSRFPSETITPWNNQVRAACVGSAKRTFVEEYRT
jgi:hypothetical protein